MNAAKVKAAKVKVTFGPDLTASTCASLFVQAYKSDLTSNNEVLPIRGVWSSIESLCI